MSGDECFELDGARIHGDPNMPAEARDALAWVIEAARRKFRAECEHPATLTVTGRPGVRWCPTCGTTILPDGTQEVTGR